MRGTPLVRKGNRADGAVLADVEQVVKEDGVNRGRIRVGRQGLDNMLAEPTNSILVLDERDGLDPNELLAVTT